MGRGEPGGWGRGRVREQERQKHRTISSPPPAGAKQTACWAACGYLPIPALPVLGRHRGRGCFGDRGGGARGEEKGLWTRRGGHALSNPGGTGREPLEVGGETEARRGYRPGPPATQVARGWPSGRKPQLLPTQLAQRNGDPLPALCRSPPRRREPTHWSCIAAIYNTLSPGGMGGQGQGGAPPL